MKSKILLLVIFAFSFGIAQASTDPDVNAKGKKDDLVGIVQSESKKPIKDVNVTAYLVSRKEKSVVTDEDGTYAFNELKPGTYKFVFEKAGFKKVTKEKVVVKTDEAFQLNIEMIENKGFDLLPSPLHFTDF
ncbi:MAG: carboxypeptidase-like regulatory domain-containing protein [Chitinophagaceae bacterium]